MITACGAFAQAYARGLGNLAAIVSELDELEPALVDAIRRRARGERFYGMVLFDHPGPKLTRLNAASVLDGVADYDLQQVALDQLAQGVAKTANDRPVRDYWHLEPHVVRLMEDFYGLADAMLVRSHAEFVRLAEISPRFVRDVERVLVEPELPPLERVLPSQPSVVVWAPRRPAHEVALHAFALRELFGELTCVTAGGPPPNQRNATFVSAGDARAIAALTGASCVVCVEPDDPGDAVAFARRGYGVVAPLTAGSQEFARGVVAWDGIPSALHACVSVAMGRPASVRPDPPPLAVAPVAPPPALARDALPLVSIVIPTYNRPRELQLLLGSLAAQTYPNVEAIVVNDCGVALDAIVAPFPFVHLVEHQTNRGGNEAINTGLGVARGTFVDLIADDDVLYPDHVERLVDALLRSGAMIAHGAGLWRQVERRADGSLGTLRVNLSHLRGTSTPSEALVSVPMAVHQLVLSRRVFSETGGLRSDAEVLVDQELLMRLAQRFTFVYADQVTSEFRDSPGSSGKTAKVPVPTIQRDLYERIHPRSDRPEIARRRERMLRGIPEQFMEWREPS